MKANELLELYATISSEKNKSGYYSKETTWKRSFPKLYNDLQTWKFPNEFRFNQKIYHYLNDDPELNLGICPECGKRCKFINSVIGYHTYCSVKCGVKSELSKEKKKQTCLNRYGCEYTFQFDEFKKKSEKTSIERYGTKHPFQTKEIQEKQQQTCLQKYGKKFYTQTEYFIDKSEKTSMERYGTKHPFQTKEIQEKQQQTCLQKYGATSYSKTCNYKNLYNNNEWVKAKQEKEYKSKKKNNSFNTSKIEEQIKLYLDGLGVSYEYQYTSDQYPFNCDFYFPDKDLYVEIQGSWTHGPRPFTRSKEDLKLLEKWQSKNTKYYQNAIETWTIRDVKKREIAKKHNLNYLEIFSCDLQTCINFIHNL